MPAHSIAFIGTGVMGRSMAGHLLKAGHALHVFNRTKAKAQALLDAAAAPGVSCQWAPAARRLAAFSLVRLWTCSVWPALSRWPAMLRPMTPVPMKAMEWVDMIGGGMLRPISPKPGRLSRRQRFGQGAAARRAAASSSSGFTRAL